MASILTKETQALAYSRVETLYLALLRPASNLVSSALAKTHSRCSEAHSRCSGRLWFKTGAAMAATSHQDSSKLPYRVNRHKSSPASALLSSNNRKDEVVDSFSK